MRRRDFISLISGAAATIPWPVSARAQQLVSKLYRIGILETVPSALNVANMSAFSKGLQELGYVEGKNYIIEYRSADGFPERFPQLASELVHLPVDLILTRGTPAALATRDATTTIPVVMAASGDPVGVGLVASLARPGGNITGLSSFTHLAVKRVELMKELVSGISRLAFLGNMSSPVLPPEWEETKRAARAFGLVADLLDVHNDADIGRAFETALIGHVEAVIVGLDAVTQAHCQLIVDLAARNRSPTIYYSREFVEAGGLMSYGPSYPQLYFDAARLVDKIIKGAKPGDLPVAQPTKLELVINLKTAKVLGIIVPPILLERAEELIE
jgi:putative ABC transport system substrate-binding protein